MGERRAGGWTRQCGSPGKVCWPLTVELEYSHRIGSIIQPELKMMVMCFRASFQPYYFSLE